MNKTIKTLQNYKDSGKKIISLTAYDYSTAKILEETDVDFVLVGDSLAMVALGHKDTLSITMDEMIHHTKAVTRATPTTLVVADMPFMSYQADFIEAINNAARFIKEAGAQAVKLEGGTEHIIAVVKRLSEIGIPVLGHLGFTPQFINSFGGYFIQAKTSDKAELLLKQARDLQEAGVFGIVLEMIPHDVAKFITENIDVPTIGIGAGPYCDGQILVIDDLLGKYSEFTPTFARKYANVADISKQAVTSYCKDVRSGNFPCEKKESFSLDTTEKQKLDLIKQV
ncbi:MAG: 3-methyl-2-oxobutanoate hydroxymethyltransferase [Vampirovibrionia bacterium]